MEISEAAPELLLAHQFRNITEHEKKIYNDRGWWIGKIRLLLPEPDGLVTRRRCKANTIGREGHGLNDAGVAS